MVGDEVGGRLTTKGAAALLGVSPAAVRQLARRGVLASERHEPTGWRLFRAEDVEAVAAGRSLVVRVPPPPRPVPTRLTFRQLDIYRYVYETTRDRGYQPSYREVGERFGIRSPTGVVTTLDALAAKGYLRPRRGGMRRLEFLKRPDGTPFSGFAEKETM